MLRKAYFAGGCFWCIEPGFEALPGVKSAVSGYSGGREANPAYSDVKAQRTGHRETVCVEYDDEMVSYQALLDAYLGSVDPFDDGGQFIDRGHSYTLAVYFTRDDERIAAERALSRRLGEEGKARSRRFCRSGAFLFRRPRGEREAVFERFPIVGSAVFLSISIGIHRPFIGLRRPRPPRQYQRQAASRRAAASVLRFPA